METRVKAPKWNGGSKKHGYSSGEAEHIRADWNQLILPYEDGKRRF